MADNAIEDLVPETDRDFLQEKGYVFTAKKVGSDVHVILRDFEFPETYTPCSADLLIILPAGYPNANLDMFWTHPDVKRVDGSWPQNCDHHENYDGLIWQRWSRHFTAAWRQNVDNLQTFVATIKRELAKGI